MSGLAYRDYWRRKQLLDGPVPHFPLRRWWAAEALCDIERVYFDAVREAPSVLDVGAGDHRMLRRFREAGYGGEFHTQDTGGEYAYDYRSLDEVRRTYGAILCLDVIEHLTLEDGLALLDRLASLLDRGGVLVIQTPNARCIRDPLGWDFTHLRCYNAPDLWAFLTTIGLECTGFRIRFGRPERGLGRIRAAASAFVITRLLGADHADNIALIARKPPG